jgi:hypothetical protein
MEKTITLPENKLENFDNIKRFRKIATKYYQNHIQGKVVNHKELGEIKFTKTGRREVLSRTTHNAVLFPKLPELIETAEYIRTEIPNHDRNDGIITFHFLANEVKIGENIYKYEFLIAEDAFGKRFYYIKNVPDSFVRQKVPGAIEDINIITGQGNFFNP